MKSTLLSFLRSLVLPYGATTGTRIVLDGVNGVIQVYDTTNTLIAQIDGNGITSLNSFGDSTMLTGSKTTWANVPPGGSTIDPGYIQSVGGPGIPQLFIVAPDYNSSGVGTYIIMSGSDGNVPSTDSQMLIQAQQIHLAARFSFIDIDQSNTPGINIVNNGSRAYIITNPAVVTRASSALVLGGAAATIPGLGQTYTNLRANAQWKATLITDSIIAATNANITTIGELIVGGALQTGQCLFANSTALNGGRACVSQQWSGTFAAGGTLTFSATGKFVGAGGTQQFAATHTSLMVEIDQ